jgi:metal-responsive CopG/Arc/MetJ family transcriptional regulator
MGDDEGIEWDGTAPVSVRLKNSLVFALDSIVERDTHKNRSDIIEQAVREFLERWYSDNDKITLTNYIEKAKLNGQCPKKKSGTNSN